MKKGKLNLNNLKVKSFSTTLDKEAIDAVKGGRVWGESLRCSQTCTNGRMNACPCQVSPDI